MKPFDKTPVVLQIIPHLSAGGAEQGCIDIAAEIKRSGAIPIVVSNGGTRLHELARVGATHINLPVHSKNPIVMLRNVKRLRKLIEKHDVDIVHARSRAPAWSAYRACKGTGAKYMTTCHAPYNIGSNAKRAYNTPITKGERVIAISHYVANYLKFNYKVDPARLRIVHRGIALEKFHPTSVTPERMIKLAKEWRLPDGASVIMLPGRLTRWKGHHVLIDAITHLKRKDIFCVLIGSDEHKKEYRQELEDTIKSKKLEGQIRIINHCDDMPAAYMLSTVVVSASTDPEGFGRVPVEGQAMGRAVIATDHGGAQETVLRGQTGWLVPPNSPIDLANAITEALSLNPSQRAILATRAMSHIAEHFTREKMADDTMNVYAELLEEKFISSHDNDTLAIENQMAAQ